MKFVLYLLVITASTTAVRVVVFLQGTTQMERQPLAYIAQQLSHHNHKVATVKSIVIPEIKQLVKQRLHEVRELQMGGGTPSAVVDKLINAPRHMWNYTGAHAYHQSSEHMTSVYSEAYASVCQAHLDTDVMPRLREGSYDVALAFLESPCNAMVANELNIPLILLDQHGFTDDLAVSAGVQPQFGHIPSSRSTYTQATLMSSLSARINNAVLWMEEYATHLSFDIVPTLTNRRYSTLDRHVNKVFANDYELAKMNPVRPTVSAAKSDAALYFVNGDSELEFAGREVPPNVVYVGGYHIETPKPLYEPWNLTVTTAMAPSGIIICNFGQRASFSAMPLAHKEAFMAVFRKLPKYRVMLVVDDLDINVTAPANVNVTRFIPQNELLGEYTVVYRNPYKTASKSSVILITNGGAHSVMEAAVYGVPMLGVPLHAPNYATMRKMEAHGMALIVDINEMNTEVLYKAVYSLLNDAKYKLAAKAYARNYNARALGGFETLLYWIEYVGENHGALAIKAGATLRDSWMPINAGLDIIAILVILPYLLFVITRSLVHMCQGSQKTKIARTKERSQKNEKKNDAKK